MKLMVLLWLCGLASLAACSHQKLTGKRVYIANRNISFILPDSMLKHSKPKYCGMGPDCSGCGYHLFCDFYSNPDSSIRILASAFTGAEPKEKAVSFERIDTATGKRNFPGGGLGSKLKSGLAVTFDSTTQTVEVAAHITLRGRPFYGVSVYKQGPHRSFHFEILVPDNSRMIQAVSVTRSSLYVKASFLNEPAKPYPGDIGKY